MLTKKAETGVVWLHKARGKDYLIKHTDRFVPKDRAVGLNGAMLATADRDVRAELQTSKPITYNTKLVVYVATANTSGKHWVMPLHQFLEEFK